MTFFKLSPEEQREASLLAMNTRINPDALLSLAVETVALRGVVRAARRNKYLRACPNVRALLDALPKRV